MQEPIANGSTPAANVPIGGNLPVDNPGECFWQTQPHPKSDYRSTEQLPEHSDIVIIGAGYAGISTAYHLLNDFKNANRSITILEARGVCSGATGRNGGHLRPDFYGHIPTYIDRAGKRAGAEIAEFEIAHLPSLKKVIEAEKIDCDFTLARTVDVWCNEEAAAKAKATFDKMVAHNFEYMNDAIFYTGKDVEGICGVKGAVACASYTAGTVWPYKFIMHLTDSILDTGKVNLQTHTPATSITPGSNGSYTIHTQRGKVHAGTVIHANNAYVAGLLPEYAKNIIPCKGICCRITVPEGTTAPLLNNSYINRTEDNTLSYLIPRADGSIIVGGAAAKFRPFKDQWYNNVDDSVLIDSAKDYYDGYMQRTYRGWENSGAKVDKIWTGVMGYSYDSNPHIGEVPAKEDQYIIAGFNGHGMPVIWLAAQELAKMVIQGIPFEKTSMPRLFQTSQFRIDRAQNGKEEDGDILGTGNFPATKQ
ncbi:FAD dependent oxidoreductase superfamily [Aspergillus avenaceus]|uniref:FAD dependent oxidoreductase superfamily n=1 Tax=Aspergillus avenaceus TaxID=36643 RepID=A0A5N6U963_ASPAV|nr:FAD dependent oxidoreductase superfamily [Aspergillus avenaceus]